MVLKSLWVYAFLMVGFCAGLQAMELEGDKKDVAIDFFNEVDSMPMSTSYSRADILNGLKLDQNSDCYSELYNALARVPEEALSDIAKAAGISSIKKGKVKLKKGKKNKKPEERIEAVLWKIQEALVAENQASQDRNEKLQEQVRELQRTNQNMESSSRWDRKKLVIGICVSFITGAVLPSVAVIVKNYVFSEEEGA